MFCLSYCSFPLVFQSRSGKEKVAVLMLGRDGGGLSWAVAEKILAALLRETLLLCSC